MIRKLIRIPIVIGIAAGFGYLIGGESRLLFGLPLMWCLVAQSFAIQILAFIPALIFNTEMFFDLTGAITYISMTLVSIVTNASPSLHQYIAAGMIMIWSGRLGSFLFMRILKVGEDSRFAPIKKDKIRFFVVWLLQGMWCIIPSSPLLVILVGKGQQKEFNILEMVGIVLWLIGFVIEALSDHQKTVFNSKPQNKGKFINVGLWRYSRHPNYFGDVLLWIGATIFAIPNLAGAQFLSLISPVFEYLLLSKMSGVPMLEKKADKKWGDERAYIEYKRSTPEMFPFGKGDEIIKSKQKSN